MELLQQQGFNSMLVSRPETRRAVLEVGPGHPQYIRYAAIILLAGQNKEMIGQPV